MKFSLRSIFLIGVLAACGEPAAPAPPPAPPPTISPPLVSPPPGAEYPAVRCLKLELTAPEVVSSPEDVLTATLTNTCDFELVAYIGGMGTGFVLEDGAGDVVWRQPGSAFLANLLRLPFAANEVKTYENPWTPDDHTSERVVLPGTYELYSVIRMQRYERPLDVFIDLESDRQPLMYRPAATR